MNKLPVIYQIIKPGYTNHIKEIKINSFKDLQQMFVFLGNIDKSYKQINYKSLIEDLYDNKYFTFKSDGKESITIELNQEAYRKFKNNIHFLKK